MVYLSIINKIKSGIINECVLDQSNQIILCKELDLIRGQPPSEGSSSEPHSTRRIHVVWDAVTACSLWFPSLIC